MDYSHYRKKASEILVLNVTMLIESFFSIGTKKLDYLAKSFSKILFVSENLLILIFHQFSAIGSPFTETLIDTKHLVLHKDS